MLRFQKYNKSPDDKTWQRSFWMSRCQTLHIIGDKCWQLYKHLFVSEVSKSETLSNQMLLKQLRLLSILTHRKGGNESVSSVQKVQHFQQQKRHSGEKSNNFKSSVTHRKGGNESVRWARFKKSHIFSSFLPWLILLLLKSAIWLTQTFYFCRRLLLLILLQTNSESQKFEDWLCLTKEWVDEKPVQAISKIHLTRLEGRLRAESTWLSVLGPAKVKIIVKLNRAVGLDWKGDERNSKLYYFEHTPHLCYSLSEL